MKFEDLQSKYPYLTKARERSVEKIADITRRLPAQSEGVSIVANGSLARAEVTSQSDFDAYPMYAPGYKRSALELFESVRAGAGLREFAVDGAFGEPVPAITMRKRIGGQGDDNRRFTRRMLLILESAPIGNRRIYDETVKSLVSRYISDDITDKQIGRFLLNDIIRFYRQMCVDFEFKTVEQTKPWGVRYIKLIFSRKLIYFSGIIMCAELANRPAQQKRDMLQRMIYMPPIDRLLYILGEDILPALHEYDNFLSVLDDKGKRDDLSAVEMLRATHSPLFKEVKDSGHRYSTKLVDLIRSRYPVEHPIREALIV